MKKGLNKYNKLLIMIAPFIVVIIVLAVVAVKSANSITTTATDKKNDSTYSYCKGLDYHLDTNATSLEKEIFSNLNTALKDKDDEKAAQYVAEHFVADFFTWTNKSGSYDVGGLYYVYSPNKKSIYDQARDTFYKYVSTYIDEYGVEELLEVKKVEVLACEDSGKFPWNGNEFDSWYVRLHWEYEKHKFSSEGFIDTINATVIKNNDGRFEIVQLYGDN